MTKRIASWFTFCVVLAAFGVADAAGPNFAEQIAAIRRAGPDGQGADAAAKAWAQLVKADVAALLPTLTALDNASPLAANWLRGAVDAIAEGAIQAGKSLPAADLEKFVFETKHDSRARRLAFDWLARVDKTATDRIIPKMANDPSIELRRDAVARLIAQADKLQQSGKRAECSAALQVALKSARDKDQIDSLVKKLRDLGQAVDLPRHFGFLMTWKTIGPFDSTGGKGFDTVYPPEKNVDTTVQHDGKRGVKVRWTDHTTKHEYGMVNLNDALKKHMGAVGYALHEFDCDADRSVELRLGSKNAWKIWVNGKLIFGRDEYHRGTRIDHYRLPVHFKQGKNVILVKCCQNEQTDSWAQEWEFQLRVCDASGTAVLSTDRQAGVRSASR